MSHLGDLIVEHGPHERDIYAAVPDGARFITLQDRGRTWFPAADLNALRDELIELRAKAVRCDTLTGMASRVVDRCNCGGAWHDAGTTGCLSAPTSPLPAQQPPAVVPGGVEAQTGAEALSDCGLAPGWHRAACPNAWAKDGDV